MLPNINRTTAVIVSGLTRRLPGPRFPNGFGKEPPNPLPPNGLLLRLNPPPPKPELLMAKSYLYLGGSCTAWIGGISRQIQH